MSWIDGFFASSYQIIQANGVALPSEAALNFLTSSGFSLADNPGNKSTDVTNTASGGGGGGAVTVVTSSTSSHAQLATLAWQLVLCNSSGGAYTQPFPASPVTGNIIVVKDSGATAATGGIYVNAILLSSSANIQDKHTMAYGTNYAWGAASGDGGGDATWYVFDGAAWEVIA